MGSLVGFKSRKTFTGKLRQSCVGALSLEKGYNISCMEKRFRAKDCVLFEKDSGK